MLTVSFPASHDWDCFRLDVGSGGIKEDCIVSENNPRKRMLDIFFFFLMTGSESGSVCCTAEEGATALSSALRKYLRKEAGWSCRPMSSIASVVL